MCWNATVSLNTYIFTLFASGFALANKVITPMEFAFVQSFSTMQLLEYFIWSKSASNAFLSKLAYFSLLIQPIFSILAIKKETKYIPYLLMGYAVFLVCVFIYKPLSKINFISTKGPNGHLAWHWLDLPLILIVIWMFFLLIRFIIQKNYIIFITVLIFVVSCYVLYHKTHTWGSMWCWVSNAIAIVFIYQVFRKEFCSI
jgi:hypothetical protein